MKNKAEEPSWFVLMLGFLAGILFCVVGFAFCAVLTVLHAPLCLLNTFNAVRWGGR